MSKPLVTDASNEKQVQRSVQKQGDARDNLRSAMRLVLETHQGRQVLWHIMSECGMFKAGYEPDANLVYFQEGERNIGTRLLTLINASDPKAYLKMQTEAAELEKIDG